MGNEPAAASQTNGGTKRTVLTAEAANLIVALIRAVAGVLTSSSAMLAELLAPPAGLGHPAALHRPDRAPSR